jgi:hypothetical protein
MNKKVFSEMLRQFDEMEGSSVARLQSQVDKLGELFEKQIVINDDLFEDIIDAIHEVKDRGEALDKRTSSQVNELMRMFQDRIAGIEQKRQQDPAAPKKKSLIGRFFGESVEQIDQRILSEAGFFKTLGNVAKNLGRGAVDAGKAAVTGAKQAVTAAGNAAINGVGDAAGAAFQYHEHGDVDDMAGLIKGANKYLANSKATISQFVVLAAQVEHDITPELVTGAIDAKAGGASTIVTTGSVTGDTVKNLTELQKSAKWVRHALALVVADCAAIAKDNPDTGKKVGAFGAKLQKMASTDQSPFDLYAGSVGHIIKLTSTNAQKAKEKQSASDATKKSRYGAAPEPQPSPDATPTVAKGRYDTKPEAPPVTESRYHRRKNASIF